MRTFLKKGLTILTLTLVFSSYTPKVALAEETEIVEQTEFTLELNDSNDGQPLAIGEVDLVATSKSDSKAKLIAKVDLPTNTAINVNYQPELYDYKWDIKKLPYGYQLPDATLIATPGSNIIDVDRDTDGVNEAVGKAKFNINIHTFPAKVNLRWELFDIPKPKNIRENPKVDDMIFTLDMGSLFAPYREREDMIVINKLATNIRRYTSLNQYEERTRYKYFFKTAAITNSKGQAKILDIAFNKWYRLALLEEDNLPDIEVCDEIVVDHCLEAKWGHKLQTTDEQMFIRGPRFINGNRTSFTYDVFYITEGNVDEILASDFNNTYASILADDYRGKKSDRELINLALRELETLPKLSAELEKQKRKLIALQNAIKESEREVIWQIKYREIEEKLTAIPTLALANWSAQLASIEKLVDALPVGVKKQEYQDLLAEWQKNLQLANSWRDKWQNILALSPQDTSQLVANKELINEANTGLTALSTVVQGALATDKEKLVQLLDALNAEQRKRQKASEIRQLHEEIKTLLEEARAVKGAERLKKLAALAKKIPLLVNDDAKKLEYLAVLNELRVAYQQQNEWLKEWGKLLNKKLTDVELQAHKVEIEKALQAMDALNSLAQKDLQTERDYLSARLLVLKSKAPTEMTGKQENSDKPKVGEATGRQENSDEPKVGEATGKQENSDKPKVGEATGKQENSDEPKVGEATGKQENSDEPKVGEARGKQENSDKPKVGEATGKQENSDEPTSTIASDGERRAVADEAVDWFNTYRKLMEEPPETLTKDDLKAVLAALQDWHKLPLAARVQLEKPLKKLLEAKEYWYRKVAAKHRNKRRAVNFTYEDWRREFSKLRNRNLGVDDENSIKLALEAFTKLPIVDQAELLPDINKLLLAQRQIDEQKLKDFKVLFSHISTENKANVSKVQHKDQVPNTAATCYIYRSVFCNLIEALKLLGVW